MRANASRSEMLQLLDGERKALDGSQGDGLRREWSADGSACRIVFAELVRSQFVEAAQGEIARARVGNYRVEWKLYFHDVMPGLAEALVASGFKPGDIETVLAADVGDFDWRSFEGEQYRTQALRNESGLADVAAISIQIGRGDVDLEIAHLRTTHFKHPDLLSIHVASIDGEPLSCGRIHYGHSAHVAELAGGRTVTTHRKQGLYTSVVGSRLREIVGRGCRYVFVDALPASQSVLTRLGFMPLTLTQPFTYDP